MHGSFESGPPDEAEEQGRPRLAGDSAKSRRTRARILDVAMRLFASAGYHPTTNAVIAEASDLTRGAMLYHFPTRADLMSAVIPFIQAERARLFEAAARQAPASADRIDHAIECYWRLLHEPAFVAFAELEAAARVDPGLRAQLRPAQEAFDRAQVGESMFGLVRAGEGPRFQASADLARFVLEGMANAHLADDADGRTARLLAVVKRAVHMLNRNVSASELWES